VVDVAKYYSLERLRPLYQTFTNMPLFIMTSDW
jgi:6-phosphofructokinase 1